MTGAGDGCRREEAPQDQIPGKKEAGEYDSFIHSFIHSFIRPFDLSRAPIFRVGLLKIAESQGILMVDIHHIIADAASMGILVRELTVFYRGEAGTLPGLRIGYKDFSQWQNAFFASGEIKGQEDYWLQRFRGSLPDLNMPLDYPRPPVRDFAGHQVTFRADRQLTDGLKQLARETGTTLYMVLMAAYQVLLFKYTAQEDIRVGLPVLGRPDAELEDLIGMFANTLVLRSYPKPFYTFEQFLDQIKKVLVEAVENQDYPFERLVDQLNLDRDPGRNPLFDTMFVLQDRPLPQAGMENLELSPYELEHHTTHFDFSLQGVEREGEIFFMLAYSTALFTPATIARFIGHFLKILAEAAANPMTELAGMEILSEEERTGILLASSTLTPGGEYDF